jgi:polysaccharide deacetylase family sporulation protein PdaB
MGASVALARVHATDRLSQPVYYIATTRKVMALTFDVSWGTAMLPKVLSVLKREHLRATFFLSGPWSKTHPDLVHAILSGGNEIASHGQRHVDLSDQSNVAIADNVGAADAILRAYVNRPLRFFRPPNGDFNARVVDIAHSLGYETVIWSIDSRDWMNPGVASIVSRVTRAAFPGAIILFHASDTCKQTYIALPLVIQSLRAAGYQLVTLGELWTMGPAMREDPRGSGRKPNSVPGLNPRISFVTATTQSHSCPSATNATG